ncbi:DUF6318 family protein [Arthrobacter sp. YC-RL1]|uniref:DUF6318 family protein n=2 Tax=Micrococcaceae TaxID=1268 RepID=UPI000A72D8F4|nr:DUF6318 family protein [Arthrobacter sp. YC-RL1]
MSARKIACVALLAASSIALAACESGPETPPTPTQSQSEENQTPDSVPTRSSTSSPSASERYEPASAVAPAKNVPIPKMPATATKNSDNGAKSFTEYYFSLINYSIETNDVEQLKKVTTRQCQVCGEDIIDPAARAKQKKMWQVGGKHHFEVVDVFKTTTKRTAVSVRYKVDKSEFYVTKNKPVATLESLPTSILAINLLFDDGWKVDSIVGEG